MNSRILNSDKSCEFEADYLGLDLQDYYLNCSTFVNPTWCNLVGKTIYRTLGNKLKNNPRVNSIISRYPMNNENPNNYKVIPYELSKKVNKSDKKLSKFIPNRYNMLSKSELDFKEEKFLLGTEIVEQNHLTCIGFMIN